MKRKKNVFISIALVVVWMGFIFLMSSMDSNESNNGSKAVSSNIVSTVDRIASAFPDSVEEPPKEEDTSIIDKVNLFVRKSSHALEYLLLSILVLNVFFQMKKYTIEFYLYSLLFNFIYACTDEYHQTFVDGRTGRFIDVLIDVGGALIGCFIFFIIYKIIRKKVVMKIKAKRSMKKKVKMA